MIEKQLEGDYRRRAIKLLMNLNALALMGPSNSDCGDRREGVGSFDLLLFIGYPFGGPGHWIFFDLGA